MSSLTVQQLREMKKELKTFGIAPIQKSYKIIATIYKSEITPKVLSESEITKSFVRIGAKQYTTHDDEKYQKAIKICRKLVKKWREFFIVEETQQQTFNNIEPLITKKVKMTQNKYEENKKQSGAPPKQVSKVQPDPQINEVRNKATQGLIKYLKAGHNQESVSGVAEQLEKVIYESHSNLDIYKQKITQLAKKLDQDKEFKEDVINGVISLKEAVNAN